VLAFDPLRETASSIVARLPAAIDSYRKEYAAYYERLQTIQFAADARSERGRVLGAGRRHDDFRER